MNLSDFKDVTSASRQVATRSAMNPILWKSAICSPIGMSVAAFAPEPLNYFVFAISALPVIVGCWGFVFFAKTDPDRLQSEAHIEQMQMLSRIGDNNTRKQILIDRSKSVSENENSEGHGNE